MGLLDMFGTSMDDPRTGATLQLAQGLLSSPRVMQGLAGGLAGYQQAMAQAKQAKMVEEMRQMQMAQQRMQMEAAQKEQARKEGIENAYRSAFRTPEQMAMAQNGGPTVAAANAAPAAQSGFDSSVLQSELSKVDPLTAYKLFGPQDPEHKVVGNSLVQIGKGGVKEVYRSDRQQSMTEIGRLMAEMAALPEGHPGRAYYEGAIRKATTHSPGVQVSYGAPVAGVDAGGNPVFFQPSKDGGAPAIIPGVAPSKDKNYTEDQAKAAGWLAQANNAYGNMLASMKDSAGKKTGAEKPEIGDMIAGVPMLGAVGNMMRTESRQKFVQASSSLSEALLRAATGAGVNADEAKQKVAELTPQFGEDAATTAQKMASIPVYIESLKVRAGPLARKPSEPAKPTAPAGISLDAIEAEIARRRAARGG